MILAVVYSRNSYTVDFPIWFLAVLAAAIVIHTYTHVKHYLRIQKRLKEREQAREEGGA